MNDTSKYLHRRDRRHTFTPKLSSIDKGETWMLAAHAGAYSGPHIDASGYCTWVRPIKGAKLWVICEKESISNDDEWTLEKEDTWVGILLEEGDVL